MYLSRIALNEQRRETMRALSSPCLLHGAVERCFDKERSRNLWRTDVGPNGMYLLLLSQNKPRMVHIAEQFGFPGSSGETKAYEPLLQCIEKNQAWQFRLRANPVHSGKQSNAGRGRIYAHVTQQQQKNWLLQRAEQHGFALQEDAFEVVDSRWYQFQKHGDNPQMVTLRTATFEGVLTVTDPERFLQALQNGIGRGKAYGCGLLTVMRHQ